MLSKRTQTIENKEFILITLTPQFESATPKRVLAFDVDDTMLDWTLSSFYHSLVLNKEKELRETLENAKKNGFELVIVTARSYETQPRTFHYMSIDNLLYKLGKDYFSGVYFTVKKHAALVDLSQRFKSRDISLIDDQESNRSPCFRFFQITDSDVYKRLQTHIHSIPNEKKDDQAALLVKLLEEENYNFVKETFSKSLWTDNEVVIKKIFLKKLLKHIKENQPDQLKELMLVISENLRGPFLTHSPNSVAEFYKTTIPYVKTLAEKRDYDTIEKIMAKFPDLAQETFINSYNQEKETLVNWAINHSNSTLIKIIGHYNKSAITHPQHKSHVSFLHEAINLYEEDCVTALIEAKADVNTHDHLNRTPLQSALLYGHADLVEELVKAGAEIFPKEHKSSECFYSSEKYYSMTLTFLEDYIHTKWPEEEKRPSLVKEHLTIINKSDTLLKKHLLEITESVKTTCSELYAMTFFGGTSDKFESLKEYLGLFLDKKLFDNLLTEKFLIPKSTVEIQKTF